MSVRTPAGVEPTDRRRWPGVACMLLFLAAYAVPVFIPPPGAAPAPVAPDAALLARLFPGVPGWWVVGRLLCLVAAAGLALRFAPDVPIAPASETSSGLGGNGVSSRRAWAAVGIAALQAVVGVWAAHFNRPMQLLYIVWFAVPPLLLVHWRGLPAAGRRRDWRAPIVVGGIVTAWLLVCVPMAWRSSRAADLLDMWNGVRFLADAVGPGFNLLTDRVLPGSGSIHFAFQGGGLSPLGVEGSFHLAQAAQSLWLAVAGVIVGGLAARVFGVAAAAVATAAFLFSPYVMMMLLGPLPFFFYPLVTAALLALLLQVHDARSGAALAALGAIGGMGATLHSASIVSIILVGVGFALALRRPRMSTPGLLTAMLSFAAALLTGLSDLEAIPKMALTYTRGRAQWVVHEMAGFGQISLLRSEPGVETAIPQLFDTPLSALLSPFALPRIPLRGLGDVLFDPIGTAFAVIGIALCLRALSISWFARVVLVVLAIGVVPASVSSQDRLSVIRLLVTTVPMALLAGLGWESVRRSLAARMGAPLVTAAATAAIAVGGIVVFDLVNPRILAASAVSVALRALDNHVPAGGAVILDHANPRSFPYWYLAEIMAAIPRQPIGVRPYDDPSSLRASADDDRPAAELFFWNPGLEEDQRVSRAVCQQWPGAALYTLTDRASLSRAFAAQPLGGSWQPALPASHWRMQRCDAILPTETTWATDVIQQARLLSAQRQQEEALALLRAAARRNFAHAGLFEATSRALVRAPTADRVREAVHWARRACEATRFQDADALATLAAAYAAAGELSQAVDAVRKARDLAVAEGNAALVARLDEQLRTYQQP